MTLLPLEIFLPRLFDVGCSWAHAFHFDIEPVIVTIAHKIDLAALGQKVGFVFDQPFQVRVLSQELRNCELVHPFGNLPVIPFRIDAARADSGLKLLPEEVAATDVNGDNIMVDCPNLLDEFVELSSLTDDANKVAHFSDHAPSCGRVGKLFDAADAVEAEADQGRARISGTPDRTSDLLNRDPGITHLRVPHAPSKTVPQSVPVNVVFSAK